MSGTCGEADEILDPPAPQDMSSFGKLYATSEDGSLPSLDWALIEVDSEFQKQDIILRPFPKRIGRKQLVETKVRTWTGSVGMMTGTLSANGSLLKVPGSQNFQEVWIVRLDGPLSKSKVVVWHIRMLINIRQRRLRIMGCRLGERRPIWTDCGRTP
jgi:hypothetical protein